MKRSVELCNEIAAANPRQGGVHSLSFDRLHLQAVAARGNAVFCEIDATECRSPASFLEALRRALRLGEDISSWELLFDAITESETFAGRPAVFLLHGTRSFEQQCEDDFDTFLKLFNDSASTVRERERRGLWCFLG